MRKAVLLCLILSVCALYRIQHKSFAELRCQMDFLTSPDLDGRRTGSAGNDVAAEYLKAEFEKLGYEARVSPYTINNCLGKYKYGSPITGKNIIVTLPVSVKESSRTIVISAHFDGVGGKDAGGYRPAADDDASGTVALLALAKKLKTRNWNLNFILIAFSGEEEGLCGSAAYTRDLSTDNIRYNIQMDMVGRPSTSTAPVVYITGDDDQAPELVSAFEMANKKSNPAIIFGKTLDPEPWWRWSSDHSSFHRAGVKSVMLCDANVTVKTPAGDKMLIHTSRDKKESINFHYLNEVVNLLFRTLEVLDAKSR